MLSDQMKRAIVLAAIVVALFCVFALTKARAAPRLHPDCNVTMPCDARTDATPARREARRDQVRRDRGRRIERAMPFGRGVRKAAPAAVVAKRAPAPVVAAPKPAPTIAGYLERVVQAAGVSLAGVVAPLADKARELSQACGARVISAVRHTRIRGTRRMSLHASGQAVDMAGDPACLYDRLRGWAGGYSTDYGRVKHVHISWSGGGREWGARFAHGGRWKSRRVRYATASR